MDHELLDLQIGNLIEVPVVQTVIDLSEVRDLDPDDPDGRVTLETLGHSFVITDDIYSILEIILGHIKRREGRGFFIVGNYGSGKSHLLSVVSLIARYSWARQSFLSRQGNLKDLNSAFSKQKLLPIMIPLTEYSGDLSLEKIVWHAVEMTVALAGIPLALSVTRRFIEVFNRYVLSVHESEFREFVKIRFDDLSWEQICREDPAAAHTIILQFVEKTRSKIPFEVMDDRKGLLDELITTVQAAGWSGILLVIDELSEFVKSKPSSRSLHEDTRFLQFLGEATANRPLWVIAALQESLEMNQDVSTNAFTKIKARYTHLKLTTKHLHQLIARRLIRKKHPDADRVIGKLFDVLQNAFNRIQIPRETFLNLYPIHPETLELLNRNVDLFSQRRGIVDFVSSRIRGRPENLIPGILDKPCHFLLTPDVIFDHFQDRLAQSDRYSDYISLFQQQLMPRIETCFTDPDERIVALKTVKVLIILAITPFDERRTTRELANMVLYRVFDASIVSGDANYAYFEEKIIRVLYQNVGFFKRFPGSTRLDDVYMIEHGKDPSLNLDDRIQRIKSSLSSSDTSIYPDIIQSMGYGVFPLATFFQKTSIRDSISWQNTRRRIAMRILTSNDLQSEPLKALRSDLTTGKIDFACIMILPDANPEKQIAIQKFLTQEPSNTSSGWGFITPVLPESPEFEDALLEVHACQVLQEELAQSSTVEENLSAQEFLRDRREKFLSISCSMLQNAYISGRLFLASGTCDLSGKQNFPHFDKWLESVLNNGLSERYPEHYRVAPKSDCQSKTIQDMIYEKFVRPGSSSKLQSGKDDVLISALETIVVPLGLAQKKSGLYQLTASPRKSAATRAIMEQLPVTSSLETSIPDISAGRVWQNVSRPPLGMSRSVFDLALVALIRKGYISAKQASRCVSLEELHLPLTGQIDRLCRGDLIPDHHRPAFYRLFKLLTNRNLTDIDLEVQDVLWKKLSAQWNEWTCGVEKFEVLLNDWTNRYQEKPEMPEIRLRIRQFRDLGDRIADVRPMEGWNHFLSIFSGLDDPELLFQSIKRIVLFGEIGISRFVTIQSYLQQLRDKIPATPGYETLLLAYSDLLEATAVSDTLILQDGLKLVIEKFELFKKSYLQTYIQEHDRINDPERTATESILRSREFLVLNRLNKIHVLSQIPSNRNVQQEAIDSQKSICQQTAETILEIVPVCACGFTLGSRIGGISTAALREKMITRIRFCHTYLKWLQDENCITADVNGEKTSERIREILSLDPDHVSFMVALDKLLDENAIIDFNESFAAVEPSVTVSFNELSSMIEGGILPVGQFRQYLSKWMKTLESFTDSEWIRFTE